jgi:hypothetical protein
MKRKSKFIILWIFSFASTQLYAGDFIENSPQGDSLLVSVSCSKTELKSSFISFELSIFNYGERSISLPDRLAGGVPGSHVSNIWYEIFFIGKDTVNISNQIVSNIKTGSPYISNYILPHLAIRKENISIPKTFFSKRGKYLIRFMLRKRSQFYYTINDIEGDVYSDWYPFFF